MFWAVRTNWVLEKPVASEIESRGLSVPVLGTRCVDESEFNRPSCDPIGSPIVFSVRDD